MSIGRLADIVILFLLVCLDTWAGVVHIEISFKKGTELSDYEFYLGADGSANAVKMDNSGSRLTADVEESESGFYKLSGVIQGGQVNTPLYIPSGTANKQLKAELKDSYFVVTTNDDDCNALTRFGHLQGMQSRRLWMEVKSEEQARTMLSGYQDMVSQADPKHKASETVRKYIDLWAFSTTYVNICNLPQILGKKANEISLKPSDIMQGVAEVMDDELALNLNSSMFIICDDLRRLPTIDGRIAALRSNYKTESVRQKAEKNLMESFIQNFDYQNKYTEGLATIGELTKKYNLPDTYLEEFRKRSSTLSGAAFPEGIELVDKDGRKMDFSQFRGKYVYVDFWASWCGPCCREVPYLQELEKKVTNPDVVFLSISIDTTKEPWLKKMESLNMHGNQWLNADNKVCEALNINSIPHFALYNKEGKLMIYDADRPSSGDRLLNMLNMLK